MVYNDEHGLDKKNPEGSDEYSRIERPKGEKRYGHQQTLDVQEEEECRYWQYMVGKI